MDFSIYGIVGQPYGGNQARFLKMVFFLQEGVKNEQFPLKFWHLKFSFLLFSKITIFAKFSKKSCFIICIDVWPLCYQ